VRFQPFDCRKDASLAFEKEYFENLEYLGREALIRRHFLEVLGWASKASRSCLSSGVDKTALDVGCAFGYGVKVLKSLGYDTCGLDVSVYSVRRAKKLDRSTDYLVCDAQHGFPFKNDAFDLITCFEVLEHLSNPLKTIKNLFASCRGAIICTTPNRTVEKPLKSLVNDCDHTHINIRTPDEWKKDLQQVFGSDAFVKVEPFLDTNLKIGDNLLFFKSFRIPFFGLDTRIIIRKK